MGSKSFLQNIGITKLGAKIVNNHKKQKRWKTILNHPAKRFKRKIIVCSCTSIALGGVCTAMVLIIQNISKHSKFVIIPRDVLDVETSPYDNRRILKGFNEGTDPYDLESFNTLHIYSDIDEVAESAFSRLNSSDNNRHFLPNNIQSIVFAKSSENGIIIGPNAFSDCDNITYISPYNVRNIGEAAFENCINIKDVPIFDDKLEMIGTRAFNNCNSMTGNLIIGVEVKSIGEAAFMNCKNINKLTINAINPTISESAFMNCYSLSDIYFQDISEIEKFSPFVFMNCRSLVTLDLRGLKKLNEIGESTFEGCESLVTIQIDNLREFNKFGKKSFKNCYSLTSISYESNSALTTIAESAFENCISLTSFGFNSTECNYTTIDSYAFKGCENLYRDMQNKKCIFPDTISKLGSKIFENTSVTEIKFNTRQMSPPTTNDQDPFGWASTGTYKIYLDNELLADSFRGRWTFYSQYIVVESIF